MQRIIYSIPDSEKDRYLNTLVERIKNPVVAFCLSYILGVLGIDRSYVGDTGLGVAKLLTLGGCGIWAFIDVFLIASRAREKNIQIAQDLKVSFV